MVPFFGHSKVVNLLVFSPSSLFLYMLLSVFILWPYHTLRSIELNVFMRSRAYVYKLLRLLMATYNNV